MSDNFAMLGLESCLSNFGIDKSPGLSLVDDPVFRIFRKALGEQCSDLKNRFQDLFQLQIYFDPAEYLAPIDGFGEEFHKSEPGQYLDYKQMREDLDNLQSYINGSKRVLLEMYDFINNLTSSHVTFVRSSIALAGWQLYAKMLDRFYGGVRDILFEKLVIETVGYANIAHWPAYHTVYTNIQIQIKQICHDIEQAKADLIYYKDPSDLAYFNSKIEEARTLRRAQIEAEEGSKQSEEVEKILSRYIGKRTRAERAERAKRKAAISLRNVQALTDRIKKNSELRRYNKNNIHQLGNMCRIPLCMSIIRAINSTHDTYMDSLFEDDDPKEQYMQELNSKNVNEETIHAAMQKMKVDDVEALEQKMNEKEPYDGLTIAEGYTVLDVHGPQIH